MGTMSPEPEALEPAANHGEWIEASGGVKGSSSYGRGP
jgi:hypothetical protein